MKSSSFPASGSPKWRGFNLLEKFNATLRNDPFRESDFDLVSELGFNFVRLPMSYHCWSNPQDWKWIDEPTMREIDQAVAWGREYGIHVSLNFHRAPGYSVNRFAEEPFCLWSDEEALEAFVYHWQFFAERYAGISSKILSFDLLNEPSFYAPGDERFVDRKTYKKVVDAAVSGIRYVDTDRLILIEGGAWGTQPYSSTPLPNGLAQSAHIYAPNQLTHWKAEFMKGVAWREDAPTWPLQDAGYRKEMDEQFEDLAAMFYGKENSKRSSPSESSQLDRDWFRRRMEAWGLLRRNGGFAHVGEFGVYHHTPHTAALAWIKDALATFEELEMGWALWELRGPFGVLDSGRKDVSYESFRGMKLDRQMLELLRANLG